MTARNNGREVEEILIPQLQKAKLLCCSWTFTSPSVNQRVFAVWKTENFWKNQYQCCVCRCFLVMKLLKRRGFGLVLTD